MNFLNCSFESAQTGGAWLPGGKTEAEGWSRVVSLSGSRDRLSRGLIGETGRVIRVRASLPRSWFKPLTVNLVCHCCDQILPGLLVAVASVSSSKWTA